MIEMFANIEVLIDPYSDFASGKVGIRALASFDIGVRQAKFLKILNGFVNY
tara:strand:- start:216 stop:368 length:153 start_codon:yes stop_codon:yes gene_type:complete